MSGTTLYTKLNLAAEPGEPGDNYGATLPADVTAGSRRMHVSPTGILNFGEEWDLGADRTTATRNPIIQGRQTLTAKNPTISIEAPAVPTDELPYYLSMFQTTEPTLNGGANDWFFELGGETNLSNPTSFCALLSDGPTQLFANGILLESMEISAQASGLTSLTASGFARQMYGTGTAPTAPLPTLPTRSIAGRVWQAKLWNVFPYSVEEEEGSAFNHLYDWTLSMNSGVMAINAQQGSVLQAGFHRFAAPFSGTLSMTVASNATTVEPFLGNRGGNVFVELYWSDAGDPSHAVAFHVAGVISSVQPIAGDQDGITTYAVEIALAHDPVTQKCITAYVRNQCADLNGGELLPGS